MKNIETNKNDSPDVWQENPWNLPYDLEHVNRIRTLSFPDKNVMSDSSESYTAKLADTPQIFRDESEDTTAAQQLESTAPAPDNRPDSGSYAAFLKNIPQIFHEQEPEYNHPAARRFQDTSPIFRDAEAQAAPQTQPNTTPSPVSPYTTFSYGPPKESAPAAREFDNTEQIFHTLPATSEELWGERKETPRSLRVARMLGRYATRLTETTVGLVYAGMAGVTGATAVILKASEVVAWQGVDTAASKLGVSPENGLRRHASSEIDIAKRTTKEYGSESRALLQRASDLISGDSHNPNWENRFAHLAEEDLKAAKRAADMGDQKATEKHMRSARTNRDIHESRQ